jgi:hypothetical protein
MIYKPKYRDPKTGELVVSNIYWYKFLLDGKLVRASTKQSNDKIARQIESARRTALAQERQGRKDAAKKFGCSEDDLLRCPRCGDLFNGALRIETNGQQFCSPACRDEWIKRHRQVPTLKEFCTDRIEPWQDRCGPPPNSHDTPRQSRARIALGRCEEAAGRLDMARFHPERPRRTLQLAQAAHQGVRRHCRGSDEA